MVLEQAPVSGMSLAIGFFSSALTLDHYLKHLPTVTYARTGANAAAAATTAAGGGGGGATPSVLNPRLAQSRSPAHTSPYSSPLHSFFRLALESIPIGPHGTALLDMFLTASIIYQMRTLERRWGSNTFLAFLITSASVGICLMHMLVTESNTPVLSVQALRVVSCGASLVPLVAMATRYIGEVPSLGRFFLRIPGTHFRITEKIYFIAPLLKLIFIPNTELQPSSYKRHEVMADIGVWNRMLLAFVGLLFGLFSARSRPLRWWMRSCGACVCKPVLTFMQPVLGIIFGPSTSVEHAIPRQRQAYAHGERVTPTSDRTSTAGTHRQQRPPPHIATMSSPAGSAAVVGDGGRYVVESLAGDETEMSHSMLRRRQVDDWMRENASPSLASFASADSNATSRGRRGATSSGGTRRHNNNNNNNSSTADRQGLNRSLESTPANAASHTSLPRTRSAPVDEAKVNQIAELGLERSREDIIAALNASSGDLNAAVQMLL